MGLFGGGKKLVAEVLINFFGKNIATINYISKNEIEDSEHEKILLFSLYYAKILYNLGEGENSRLLIEDIENCIKKIFDFKKRKPIRSNILNEKIVLAKSREGKPEKVYSARMIQKPNDEYFVDTKMSWGGENYYAPISVMILLQYLINTLSENYLSALIALIMGMNDYYHRDDCFSITSLIEAPEYGFKKIDELTD